MKSFPLIVLLIFQSPLAFPQPDPSLYSSHKDRYKADSLVFNADSSLRDSYGTAMESTSQARSRESGLFDSFPDYLLAIVGLGGFWYGLLQYRADRKWKRKQFAADVMNKIKDDFELRLAVTFLDWRERDILIPDRYLTKKSLRKSFRHTYELMASAFDMNLRETLPETNSFDLKLAHLTLERMIYVDVFERFFLYLEDICAFIETDLVKWKDVETLCYWAKQLCDFKFNGNPVFHGYFKAYGYTGVIRLANRYESESEGSSGYN